MLVERWKENWEEELFGKTVWGAEYLEQQMLD